MVTGRHRVVGWVVWVLLFVVCLEFRWVGVFETGLDRQAGRILNLTPETYPHSLYARHLLLHCLPLFLPPYLLPHATHTGACRCTHVPTSCRCLPLPLLCINFPLHFCTACLSAFSLHSSAYAFLPFSCLPSPSLSLSVTFSHLSSHACPSSPAACLGRRHPCLLCTLFCCFLFCSAAFCCQCLL